MMRRDRCVTLSVAVAVMLAASPLFAAAGPAQAPPRLSEQQARQRAAAVAKAIGQPWDATATAMVTGPNWLVRCQGASLHIKGDTGQVVAFELRRGALSRRVEEPISEEQAMAIAARAMKAFGAPAEAAPTDPRYAASSWWISCKRTAGGVPYEDDVALLSLDSTGRLRRAQLKWTPGAPPATTKVSVTKEQAIRAAKGFVERARLPGSDDQFIEATLRVVSPNDYYSAPRSAAEGSPATRVAWVVSFPRPLSGSLTSRRLGPRQGPDWRRDVVWVDAADGKVLGGKSGPAGSPPPETIQRVVAHRRSRLASVAGAIAAAALVVGLVVWARRRPKRAVQAS